MLLVFFTINDPFVCSGGEIIYLVLLPVFVPTLGKPFLLLRLLINNDFVVPSYFSIIDDSPFLLVYNEILLGEVTVLPL